MKKLLSLILVISILILTLSACSLFQEEVLMVSIRTPNVFENERFLLIYDFLVNKQTNSVHRLKCDDTKKSPYYAPLAISPNLIYNVEFQKAVFTVYGFSYDYRYFYDATVTFTYAGEEISSAYSNKTLTEDEAKLIYSEKISNSNDSCAFAFRTFRGSGEAYSQNLTTDNQAILKFVNVRYLPQNNGNNSDIYVVSNPIGEEIWFSTTATNKLHGNVASPILNGIYKSEIFTYNTTTKEFKQICDYSIKKRQIIDLDTKGFYTIDINGNLRYFDYMTKKESLIHTFSYKDYEFYISDNYIFAKQYDDYYFYNKGNLAV